MKLLTTQPSLSRDFTLLAGVIVLLSLFVALWMSYQTYLDHSEKVVKDLETEATRLDRAFIIELEHASYVLESLAHQIANHGDPDPVYIARLMKSFDVDTTQHHVFSWADENQMSMITSHKGILPQKVDVSDRDFIKKTLTEPWKVQIGRPIEGRVSDKWVLPLSVGVTDDTGKFLGTVTLSLDIARLTEKFERVIDKAAIGFAITTDSFALVTQSTVEENFFENVFPKNQLARIDLGTQTNGVLSRANPFDATQSYTFYEHSSKYPFIFFLATNARLNQAVIHGQLIPRLLQLVIVSGFLILLLWLLRHRVIDPLMELAGVATGIARGEGFRALSKSGPLELQQLATQIKTIDEYINERKRLEGELLHKTHTLKRAKETAELTNRIKVDFLASMSQELRTPLNNIVGFSEVMKNQLYGPLENPTYLQYAQDIYHSSQQLLEVINDVLALSKMESGLLEVKEKPLKLDFVVSKCIRLMQEKLNEHAISVRNTISDNLPKLMMDELRLKQIVINLIAHVAKTTPRGHEIVVEARLDDEHKNRTSLAMIVRRGELLDNMAVSAAASAGGARVSEFSGLALPLTQTLAAMHQVEMKVENVPGRGVQISLRFPKERLVFWEEVENKR